MNKLVLIALLLVGVSSTLAVPFLSGAVNRLTASLSGSSDHPNTVAEAVVVPLAGAANTILTRPGELLGSATPSPAQLASTLELIYDFPEGAVYVASTQLTEEQLLSNLNNTENILKNFNSSNPLKTAYTGIQIGSGANANSVGALSLPTYSLCPLKIQYALTSCFICNQDCYVAHNLWGGKCGKSPRTGGDTCLCGANQTDADEREITPRSTETCEVYNPLGDVVDLVIGIGFRVRSLALQCRQNSDGSYDSTGCDVDCFQNHGYESGVCQVQYPNVDNKIYADPSQQRLYCICTNNGTLSTTGNATPITRSAGTPIVPDPTTTTASPDASSSSSTTSGY